MIQKLLKLLHDPTRRHIAINTAGNYLNVFFTAVFALILVRIMTPEQYGVLSVLLGVVYVLANIMEFGTAATIFSSVPSLYENKDQRVFQFIKSIFFYQSLFSLIVLAFFFIFFPFLDRVFFKTGAPNWVLYITAFSVLMLIWQNFFMNILFASKNFLRANLYVNLGNIVKALAILFFAVTGNVSVGLIIFIYGFIGPATFFISLLTTNLKHLSPLVNANIKKEEFKFSYTLTYFFASQFYNLGLRMDLFMISFYSLGAAVGFYGLAQKIILSIITSIISITQVLSPRFATVKNKAEAIVQMRVAFKYLLIPSAIFLALFFTPDFVFSLVFTENFGQTAAITKVLTLPFILNALGTVPMLFLLYTARKPGFILISNILFFITISVGSYYLIPTRGVFGPPIAIAVAFVVAVAIQIAASVKEYQRLPA